MDFIITDAQRMELGYLAASAGIDLELSECLRIFLRWKTIYCV